LTFISFSVIDHLLDIIIFFLPVCNKFVLSQQQSVWLSGSWKYCSSLEWMWLSPTENTWLLISKLCKFIPSS